MPTLSAELYNRENNNLIATVSFHQEHWSEQAVRNALVVFFDYGDLAPGQMLETQLKSNSNMKEIDALVRRGGDALIKLLIRRRGPGNALPGESRVTPEQQLSTFLHTVYDTLHDRGYPVQNMQPSDLRKAIETLGDDNRQKKTWLDGIGLSLTTSGLIAANPTPDPRTYKQHIDGLISTNRALQQKLTSLQGDLQRLKDELVQAQAQRNALESEVQFHREQERARAHGANAYSYQDPPAGEPAGGGGFAPYSGPNWPPGGNNV